MFSLYDSSVYFLKIFILTTLLLCVSCTETNKTFSGKLIPVESENVLLLPEYLHYSKIWSREFPNSYSLLAADLYGDKKIELICSSSLKTSILSLEGKELRSFPLEQGETPLITRDLDNDGKKDIIFHTPHGPKAVLKVYDGLGRELSILSPKVNGSKFARLTVEHIDRESAYLRLNADNVLSLRGYMKVSLPELQPQWFFSMTSIPEQLFYSDFFYPGFKTTYTDMNVFFGKEMISRQDLETDFVFLSIDQEGDFDKITHYEKLEYPMRGRIRYLKKADNGFLILHESDYFDSEMFRYLSLNKEGIITDKTDFYPGIPEKWVKSQNGNLIISAKGIEGKSLYHQITINDIKGKLKILLKDYTKPIDLFPPYIISDNPPPQFIEMNRFLFLDYPDQTPDHPDYLLTANENSVSLYRIQNKYDIIKPDYSTDFASDFEMFSFNKSIQWPINGDHDLVTKHNFTIKNQQINP